MFIAYLSTGLSDSISSVKRIVDKHSMDVSCPEIVVDYNKHMGGVDLADQAMCYYSVGRKTQVVAKNFLAYA